GPGCRARARHDDTVSVRLGVYSDLEFWQRDGRPVAQESFLLFAAALRPHVEALVVAGRLAEESADAAYAVPDDAEFVALPHYAALSRPTAALRAVRGSLRAFGALVDRVDAVWLLGPHPLAIAFALQARRRGRAVVLAALVGRGVDARLTVCGTGTLHDALAARLAERGVAERAELLGHVSLDGALRALYSDSDALLHVSWTEGVPQVLFEAYAA